jgi:tRNA A-37 threonylcarbamoyl transferase component Bud32
MGGEHTDGEHTDSRGRYPVRAGDQGSEPDSGPPQAEPVGALDERIVALAAGTGREHRADATWSYLLDPRMPVIEHGWKLHVSARPADYEAVIGRVVPILLLHPCHAKFARDAETLRRMNSGRENPAAVGKAITVYPSPDSVVELAESLIKAVRNRTGPRVVSDRRVHPDAPVYYRYGPFRPTYRAARGTAEPELVMTGPDGQVFSGYAETAYRCPPWTTDPFEPTPDLGTTEAPVTAPVPQEAALVPQPSNVRSARRVVRLDNRYEITAGISRSPQGAVYRAADLQTGEAVVVKQARAFVAEDKDGLDARDRLRHERRVLAALDGVDGVPRLIDYFRSGADEYLVTSSCGSRNLHRDVLDHGPYSATGAARRGGPELARRLLGILDAAHAHGVIMRDLKPDNVVVDDEDLCHLVDFGISSLYGAGPVGYSRGYGLPDEGKTAGPADDYYALGMTLDFALTGVDPVVIDPQEAVNRDRTLAGLELALGLSGVQAPQMADLVADLTSVAPTRRALGAARIRKGGSAGAELPDARPHAATVSTGLLDEIIANTVALCVDHVFEIVDAPGRPGSPPIAVDLHNGAAGLGWELLQHIGRPGVRDATDRLVEWMLAQQRDIGPGLYLGAAGVDVFLAAAGSTGAHRMTVTEPGEAPDQAIEDDPRAVDQISGVSGIGTARLLLARSAQANGDALNAERHLTVAAQCAKSLISDRRSAARGTGVPEMPGSRASREAFAHGRAGIAYFLVEYSRFVPDPVVAEAAREACASLAAAVPGLIESAADPGATPRLASWCNGLAGIGMVLLRAAAHDGDAGYGDLAARAGRACLTLAPRVALVTQCCGLAGVGDLMVDLAVATGDEEFRAAARTVAALILARSGGDLSRPRFPDSTLIHVASGWAEGSAGVLGFLRRLRGNGGPRLGFLD